ncbi:hypothetical protein ACH49_16740 [Streptomyces leeuwenhoekii]|uniref:HNH endonuclease n=1 Tax=Streptomyces leeuwenhoekii TaxID=1437453 RepID=A0ABR5HX97_STRLW|nr:hypothetical protein [Streptomyces leeuwenhoekii]KMS78328.1 hypothetical protein ACH49_16740 [Streptomyces leeuwenhoekii]
MNRQQILDLYAWEEGVCFRCPSKGLVPTAHVETIRPSAGGVQDVRACRDCILQMEADRKSAAARRGRPYSPGRIGIDDEGD